MLFYFVAIGFRLSSNRPIYARRLPSSCSAIPLKWARTLVIGKAPFVLCLQIDLGPTQWATNWGKMGISDQDDYIARSSAQSLIDPLLTPTKMQKMQYIYIYDNTNYAILNCKTNCCEANNKKINKKKNFIQGFASQHTSQSQFWHGGCYAFITMVLCLELTLPITKQPL